MTCSHSTVNLDTPSACGGVVHFPVYFIVSGIASGAALLLMIHHIACRGKVPAELESPMTALGKLLGATISLILLMRIGKIITSLGGAVSARQSALALLSGPLSQSFWIGEVILAGVLPLGLILATKARNTRLLGWVGGLFLIGSFMAKTNMIVADQLTSVKESYFGGISQSPALIDYCVASSEWLVLVFGLGLFFTLHFLGEKLLKLNATSP
jgi:hypothetical protein